MTNQNLWNRNVELRDNGSITVGSIVRFIAPLLVKTLMSGDIAMLETKFPLFLMTNPSSFVSIMINYKIEGNASLAFIENNAKLSIFCSTPEATKCSVFFCDKQRLINWVNVLGCGCYHMNHQRSNIAFDHSILVETQGSGPIQISNFSSSKFSMLYLSKDLPPSIAQSEISLTDKFFEILDSIDKVIQLINDNDGFKVIGWYKRGVINDRYLVMKGNGTGNNGNTNEEVQVQSGDVNYHILELQPSNRSFADKTSGLGMRLETRKFDVSRLG